MEPRWKSPWPPNIRRAWTGPARAMRARARSTKLGLLATALLDLHPRGPAEDRLARGAHLVEPAPHRLAGRGLQPLGIGPGLGGDGPHPLDEGVERLPRLGLGGL